MAWRCSEADCPNRTNCKIEHAGDWAIRAGFYTGGLSLPLVPAAGLPSYRTMLSPSAPDSLYVHKNKHLPGVAAKRTVPTGLDRLHFGTWRSVSVREGRSTTSICPRFMGRWGASNLTDCSLANASSLECDLSNGAVNPDYGDGSLSAQLCHAHGFHLPSSLSLGMVMPSENENMRKMRK